VLVLRFTPNTQGFVAAMAALNDSGSPVTATIAFRDEEGETLGTGTLALSPNSRAAFALPERFAATAGRRGAAAFSGAEISVLGLRFHPQGSFTSMAPVRK
jgi:hypothetical protein